MRPWKGVFFSIYWFSIESPKNPIPLLHFCLKKLNHEFNINLLHMPNFSMASSPELYEIVFPENCIIHNKRSKSWFKFLKQQLDLLIDAVAGIWNIS